MTAIYLVIGIAALVWGTILVLRGSLIGVCLAFLVVAACFGHAFVHFELGPLPLTLDRLVLLLLLVTYTVQRRLGRAEPKPLAWPDLCLMAFLGVLILSGFSSGWGGGQFGVGSENSPLFRLIGGYLIPFLLYWIARQSPLDRSKISLVQGTLVGLGVYLAVTGLAEITGQWWAVFPKHIADPQLGIHFGRARGPMVHAVSFGMYLGICVMAMWTWRWRLGRLGQLVIVALMPLMLAGVYFSYTRSVWMGTGLGLAIILGLTLRGFWRPLVLGGMMAGVLLLLATRLDRMVSFQREHSAEASGGSVALRGSFAYISWQMFLDRPLLGVGFGQFPEAKLPYLADRSTSLNLQATHHLSHHNTFLSVLTETGLIGLALLLAVLIGWGRAAWDLARSPQSPDWARAYGVMLLGVLGVYACQLAFHELSYTAIDNALVFFLAGTTVAVRSQIMPKPAPARTQFDNVSLRHPAPT